MAHDFAKTRIKSDPEPEKTRSAASGWGLLITGLLTGLTLGLFISLLVYLSGILPPLTPAPAVAVSNQDAGEVAAAQQQLSEDLGKAAEKLQLEFYKELPNYEVIVNATPVDIDEPEPMAATAAVQEGQPRQESTPISRRSGSFMLQAGAFQQESAADQLRLRLTGLGLDVRVKKEALLGKTLFLVQTGPFSTRAQLSQAERILQNNSIDSMRVGLN